MSVKRKALTIVRTCSYGAIKINFNMVVKQYDFFDEKVDEHLRFEPQCLLVILFYFLWRELYGALAFLNENLPF